MDIETAFGMLADVTRDESVRELINHLRIHGPNENLVNDLLNRHAAREEESEEKKLIMDIVNRLRFYM